MEPRTRQIEERLRDFLMEEKHWHGPRSELTDNLPLISTVLDSIGVMTLVSLIEDEFGVEIRDEDLLFENFGTIARITSFIERSSSIAPQ